MPGPVERDIRWWPVRNNSGEEIPPFAVMRISGEETVGGRTRFIVAKPDSTFRRKGYLINSPFAIGIGKSGSGTRDTTYALCSSSASPVRDQWWGAKDGEWKLFQHRPGFLVLGNYQGTGDGQRSIVEPFEVTRVRCVLAATLNQGSAAAGTIYMRDGSARTDSGCDDITIYDDLLPSAGSIASGGIVWADWYCDRWWAIEARCQ